MLDLSRLGEAVRSEGGVSRRLFLAYGAALAALPTLAAQDGGRGPQGDVPGRPVLAGRGLRRSGMPRASCCGPDSLRSRSTRTAG